MRVFAFRVCVGMGQTNHETRSVLDGPQATVPAPRSFRGSRPDMIVFCFHFILFCFAFPLPCGASKPKSRLHRRKNKPSLVEESNDAPPPKETKHKYFVLLETSKSCARDTRAHHPRMPKFEILTKQGKTILRYTSSPSPAKIQPPLTPETDAFRPNRMDATLRNKRP